MDTEDTSNHVAYTVESQLWLNEFEKFSSMTKKNLALTAANLSVLLNKVYAERDNARADADGLREKLAKVEPYCLID